MAAVVVSEKTIMTGNPTKYLQEQLAMTTPELIHIYEHILLALSTHASNVFMDDSEHIQIIRVLTQTAGALLEEDGEINANIDKATSSLIDYAKNLYVASCLKAHSEISNQQDYADESGEMFDYVFQHGSYPDE
jgi:hypothetical protein